jgi:hypothetical protein
MASRKRPGTIVRIDLDDGYHTYGRELQHPFLAILDARTKEEMTPEQIVAHRPLFIVGVFDQALKRWKPIGYVPLLPNELPVPDRFIQDIINPNDCRIVNAYGDERPATIAECEGLESATIWDSDEVEDRLRDYYAGRTNVWVESLRVKRLSAGTPESVALYP